MQFLYLFLFLSKIMKDLNPSKSKDKKGKEKIIDYNEVFESFKRDDNQIEYFGKGLGKGAYGDVREVKLKNNVKVMAAKLIKREKNEPLIEIKVSQEIRGNNIIKISKTISKEYNGKEYELIIMEKALLRDLGKLTEFYYHHNLLKLINKPFIQLIGDNFLRFYSKQIIDGLELLDKGYFIHFDIKPENLLITMNLNIKLSDFSLLKKVKDEDIIKIPGGTLGFLTKEYYFSKNVSAEVARKQDYFALGSTLFYLKYGKPLLKYQKYQDPASNAGRIVDLLHKSIGFIRSRQENDKDFIDFLVSLIEYDPEERPNFKLIYRNKWLNKNIDAIEAITSSNENDEEKLIMELQKSDFLINREESRKKKLPKFVFKKKKKSIYFFK